MTSIVGIVRFSVLSTTYNPFRASRELSFSDYADRVLSRERLERRFALFENVCLASLDAQTDDDFKILAVTSRLLPDPFRIRLEELAETRSYLSVRYAHEQEFRMSDLSRGIVADDVSSADLFATFRLDDDDAVAEKYVARLRRYLKRDLAGFCVSLCSGFYLDIGDDASRVGLVEKIVPNASVGLALVSRRREPETLFDISDRHKRMHERRPVLTGAARPSFVLVTHGENDTGSSRVVSDRPLAPDAAKDRLKQAGFTVDVDGLRDRLLQMDSPVA